MMHFLDFFLEKTRMSSTPSAPCEKKQSKTLLWDSREYDLETFVYLCYCNIGTYKYWVSHSTTPEIFFDNYHQLLRQLTALSKYESSYSFCDPKPSEELIQYTESFPDLVNKLILRAWDSCLNKAASRKTISSRKEIIVQFFETMQTFSSQIPPQCNNTLLDLKSSPISFDQIKRKEKPLPAFDFEEESRLLASLNQSHSASDVYFSLLALLNFYYKFRNLDDFYIQLCKEYCLKSIALLPKVDQEHRLAFGCPFVAHIPAFDRLYMIAYRANDYTSALHVCQQHLNCKQAGKSEADLRIINKRISQCQKKLSNTSTPVV